MDELAKRAEAESRSMTELLERQRRRIADAAGEDDRRSARLTGASAAGCKSRREGEG